MNLTHFPHPDMHLVSPPGSLPLATRSTWGRDDDLPGHPYNDPDIVWPSDTPPPAEEMDE